MKTNRSSSYFLMFVSLILALSLVLGGCAPQQAPADTPTPSPAPTDTPQPTSTFTPVPTETPTATPTVTRTATPDRKATQAARQTATQEAANEMVAKELEKLGIDPSLGHVSWVMKEPVELDGGGYSMGWFNPILEVGVLKDFVIQSEVTWNTSGALAGCAYLFRAPEDWDMKTGDSYDLVMLRNKYDPVWSIDYFKDGRWEYSLPSFEGVHSANINDEEFSKNVLTLDARGENFTIYINGVKERTIQNNKITEGSIAFEVVQNSGSSYCMFENGWIWEYDE